MNLLKKWWFWLIVILIIAISYFFFPKILYSIEPSFEEGQTEFSNLEIKRAIYSTYKFPEYFYQDKVRKGEDISDLIGYSTTWDYNASKRYHYCTNDVEEAKQKVEESINKNNEEVTERTGIEKLINSSENEKYFEFETLEISEMLPPKKHYRYREHRIFKCSYLPDLIVHNLYEQENEDGYYHKGTLAKRPITEENARELIESLWYSAVSHFGGATVLSSQVDDNENAVNHTMYITRTIGGDWGTCDTITLLKIKHSIDKSTGEIKVAKQEEIRTIQGKCN